MHIRPAQHARVVRLAVPSLYTRPVGILFCLAPPSRPHTALLDARRSYRYRTYLPSPHHSLPSNSPYRTTAQDSTSLKRDPKALSRENPLGTRLPQSKAKHARPAPRRPRRLSRAHHRARSALLDSDARSGRERHSRALRLGAGERRVYYVCTWVGDMDRWRWGMERGRQIIT